MTFNTLAFVNRILLQPAAAMVGFLIDKAPARHDGALATQFMLCYASRPGCFVTKLDS